MPLEQTQAESVENPTQLGAAAMARRCTALNSSLQRRGYGKLSGQSTTTSTNIGLQLDRDHRLNESQVKAVHCDREKRVLV